MSAFRIVKGAGTWWPVTWAEPLDGGEVAECQIEVKFRRHPWERVDELYKLGNHQFAAEVALDWRGIEDDAGRPAPMFGSEGSSDALTEMLSRPAFAVALGAAYVAFLRAQPETRLGNSAASPAGGPAAGGSTDAAPAGSPS